MRDRPLAIALSGAVFTSLSAITFQLSEADPVTATYVRFLVSLPLLGVLLALSRRRDDRTTRDRLMAVGSGVVFSIDIVLWQAAVDDIGAGLGTLIANSQVVIVPLVTWAAFGERPANRAFVAMPIVLGGLALVTGLGSEDAFGENPLRGVALGVAAAFFYSGFLVVFRRSNRAQAPMAGPLLDVGVGAVITAVVIGVVIADIDFAPTGASLGWLVALGVGAMIGWLLIGFALPRLPATHTSFAILLQPCLTIIWGAVLLAERPAPIQFAGVAVVLGGIALATRPDRSA